MADTTSAPSASKGMGNLAILFVLWYAFNAYYNVSNKMVVRTWFFPYTCAFLQVRGATAVYNCCRAKVLGAHTAILIFASSFVLVRVFVLLSRGDSCLLR